MSKKFQLTLLFFLLAISVYFINKNTNTSSKFKYQDFSINDTASISKLILTNSKSQQITLEKQESHWIVNHSLTANKHMVDQALTTLIQIRVKEPVSHDERENVIQLIKTKATKIEVFNDKNCIKTFFLSQPTIDSLGTYAQIADAPFPFIIEIPGFQGFLSNRFPTNEHAWQSQTNTSTKPLSIISVKIDYSKFTNESFHIICNDENYRIFDHKRKLLKNYKSEAIASYMKKLSILNFTTFKTQANLPIDSLKQAIPSQTILIEYQNKQTLELKTFAKPSSGKANFFGNTISIDPHFFYIQVNGNYFMATYSEFTPIYKKRSSFL